MASAAMEDEAVTMVDVLEQQEAFEEDAHAVLGASDDRNCTYQQGYVRRQALYACLTCAAGSKAGVCLACSLACHDGHELVELYTKRQFRCDCGGPQLASPCTFGGRREANADNQYNHNFTGAYCNCRRPYPDPDPEAPEDDMLQCVVCEDWLHARHLGSSVPSRYSEMICGDCTKSKPILSNYFGLTVTDADDTMDLDTTIDSKTADTTIVEADKAPESEQSLNDTKPDAALDSADITAPESGEIKPELPKEDLNNTTEAAEAPSDQPELPNNPENVTEEAKQNPETESAELDQPKPEESVQAVVAEKRSLEEPEEDRPAKKLKAECTKPEITNIIREGAIFWPSDWRNKLCTCSDCLEVYKSQNVLYLTDVEDTVDAYESLGKKKAPSGASQYEKGLEALSSLGRVQQINAITEYNKMKEKLLEFLKTFKDKREIVKEEDIKVFFAGMKPRREPDGVYFCR